MARCPTCRKAAAPRGENAFFPFCSERCKLVDLGKWFAGEYRIPVAPPPEGDSPEPSPADDDELA
jgi:endogenous inhibitor of DNA gyrase (YacG/DUF329 family)